MVALAPDQLELMEFNVVKPARDQVLIRTRVTSVCASDPKILHGTAPLGTFPMILGHELAGEVAEIGADAAAVHGLRPGDRVTIEPAIPCGRCHWCHTEFNYHKCRPLMAYGVTLSSAEAPHLFGGYAEYMYLLPRSRVYKVRDEIPWLAASLSSVIGNGVRWITNLGQMTPGQSLAISGAGSQGLAALIAAREYGIGPIAVLGLGRDSARLALAREFGADFTVNVEEQNPVEVIPALLGEQPDVVVETSGAPAAIQTAIDLVKPLGRVASIGLSGKPTAVNFDELVAKGVTIHCDHAQAGNYPEAMRIINSGKYPIEKINNVQYRLEDLHRALQDTSHPPDGFIKGAIVFR